MWYNLKGFLFVAMLTSPLIVLGCVDWQIYQHDAAVKHDLDRMEQCLIKESAQ